MKQTNTILDSIVANKQKYLQTRKKQLPMSQIDQTISQSTDGGPDLYQALKTHTGRPKLIAEAKKASPSAGVLRDPFDLNEINYAYQACHEVVAISVITEVDHFQGSEANLQYFAVHNTNNKPLLRKDFIIEPYQIYETKALGGHAYLLIAALFDLADLQELVAIGQSIGLEPLIEAHTAEELAVACATTARCIGVNARNLHDFSINHAAPELLGQLNKSYARVAESGIETAIDISRVMEYSDAALVGSYLMKQPDITKALQTLTGVAI